MLQAVRRESDVPVIIVTAMGDAEDRIGALRFGADDYVCKPYHPGEVIARVHAVLRRAEKNRSFIRYRLTGREDNLAVSDGLYRDHARNGERWQQQWISS